MPTPLRSSKPRNLKPAQSFFRASLDRIALPDLSARLLPVLEFIHARESGLSVIEAARLVGVPYPSAWRRGKRFLEHGLAGLARRRRNGDGNAPLEFTRDTSPDETASRETLRHVVRYVLGCFKGKPAHEASAGIPVPQPLLFDLGLRLLKYGADRLDPDWRRRQRWKAQMEDYGVTPQVVDEVERIAGQLGSVRGAWRLFSRSPVCPSRLAIRLRKAEPLPQSFLHAVRLEPIEARACRGLSGRIYVEVAGKQTTIEKPNRAHSQN